MPSSSASAVTVRDSSSGIWSSTRTFIWAKVRPLSSITRKTSPLSRTHAAEDQRAQLDAPDRSRPWLLVSDRCFHMRKGYTLATFSKLQRSVTRVTERRRVHPAPTICWPAANGERCPARSRSRLAPLHATARLGGRGAVDDRVGRGDRADRHRRPPLSRRRLLALVQRPRPSAPGDRRRDSRAARPRRPLDDARPLPPRGGRARRPAGRDRPRGAQPGLLLGLRLDRRRGRPQDGLPVLAAPGRPARPEDVVHLPRGRLPRGHDRVGLGRRDAPLPLAPSARCSSRPTGRSPATSTTWPACSPCARRRSPPSCSSRSCRAPRGCSPTRRATCARSGGSATATASC